MISFPEGSYDVVLADPPWDYFGEQDKWGAAAKFYALMDDAQLERFPMRDMMNDPGVLFLWATGPKIHKATHMIESWGLHCRGMGFVWIKTKANGEPIGAQGVRPSIVKPLTEFVLCASTKAKGRPLPLASEAVVQTVFAPRREHSRKPDEVQERIEQLYPAQSKLELFARHRRPGWDAWGAEAP